MYLLDNDDKESTKPVKKVRDHRAEKNPHYNHPMTQESRNAISASQKARYSYYKTAIANMMTEDRVREIIKETIENYLSQNLLETKNNRPNIPL